jgi:hypothetical protein
MEYNAAKELLEKYWKCETSLQEEDKLRRYFQQQDIPQDLRKYSGMFRYFSSGRGKELDGSFDDRIIRMIGNRKSGRQRFLSSLFKIAAAVLLILSFVVINERVIKVKDQAKKVVEDTFKDPEKALEETKKVLFYVSEKLNRGQAEAEKLNKFKKAENVVRNTNYKEI